MVVFLLNLINLNVSTIVNYYLVHWLWVTLIREHHPSYILSGLDCYSTRHVTYFRVIVV